MERACRAFRERTSRAVHLFAFRLRLRVLRLRGSHPVRAHCGNTAKAGLYAGAHWRLREPFVFGGGIKGGAPCTARRRYGFAFATRVRISRSFAFTFAAFSRPMRSSTFCPAERDWSSGSAYS